MASVSTLVNRMRYWCAVANLGYSQTDRWNFNPQAGNCDCSSLVIHCLKEAGFDTGSASYTGNLSSNLVARGWKRLPVDGHPQAGDILLNDVHHVAVYLGGGQLAQASISEKGTVSGKAGDQTGRETNIRGYYDYPWSCYLRYVGAQSATSNTSDGMLAVDGNVGSATVRKWQQVMGTTVDGIISGQLVPDEKTYWRPAIDSSVVRYGGTGSDLIRAVQKTLGCGVDGLLGPVTIKAIQAHYNLTQDASFGPATARALQAALNDNRF